MRFNYKFFLVILALLTSASIFSVSMAGDFAIYSGPTNPGWISDGAVEEIVKTGKFNPPTPPSSSRMKGAEASTPIEKKPKKTPPKIDPDLGSAPEPAPA